jgi:hypothetical protein
MSLQSLRIALTLHRRSYHCCHFFRKYRGYYGWNLFLHFHSTSKKLRYLTLNGPLTYCMAWDEHIERPEGMIRIVEFLDWIVGLEADYPGRCLMVDLNSSKQIIKRRHAHFPPHCYSSCFTSVRRGLIYVVEDKSLCKLRNKPTGYSCSLMIRSRSNWYSVIYKVTSRTTRLIRIVEYSAGFTSNPDYVFDSLFYLLWVFTTKNSKNMCISFAMSVCPSACNNLEIAEDIFMTFDIRKFY